MDWARKIKELRYFEDLKQDVLARQLGVSQASVSQWERGVAEPPEQVQRRLLRRLAQTPPERYLRALKASVKASPNVAFLMVRREGEILLEMISDGAVHLTDFLKHEDVGQPLRGRFGPVVDSHLDELEREGLFEGKLEAARGTAMLHRDGMARPVTVSIIPFRVEKIDTDYVVRVEVRFPLAPESELHTIQSELVLIPLKKPELEF